MTDEIQMDSLRDSAAAFQAAIANYTGKTDNAFTSDVADWVSLSLHRINLFIEYFTIATTVQNDEASMQALKTRVNITNQRLQDEQNQMAGVVTGAQLVMEQHQKQSMLVLKYLHAYWQQYRYFALKPVSQMPDLTKLPDNPTSDDISQIQSQIQSMYEKEMGVQASAGSNKEWIYVDVTKLPSLTPCPPFGLCPTHRCVRVTLSATPRRWCFPSPSTTQRGRRPPSITRSAVRHRCLFAECSR